MSKYPPTHRTTAGKLAPGDVILVRDRVADGLPLVGSTYRDVRRLPAGIHRVETITSELNHSGRRAVRYYHVALVASDDQARHVVQVSAVQRFNQVDR